MFMFCKGALVPFLYSPAHSIHTNRQSYIFHLSICTVKKIKCLTFITSLIIPPVQFRTLTKLKTSQAHFYCHTRQFPILPHGRLRYALRNSDFALQVRMLGFVIGDPGQMGAINVIVLMHTFKSPKTPRQLVKI